MPKLSISLRPLQQVVAALIVAHFLLLGHLFFLTLVLLLLLFAHWTLQCLIWLYLTFMIFDWNTPHTGGRGVGSFWFRNWAIWEHFVNYFPLDLVKTVDLPSNRNYVVALFPHGVMCFSAWATFGTHKSKWKDLFPGIRSKLITLNLQFRIPIFREFLLSMGVVSTEPRSISCLLNASNEPMDKLNARDGYTSNAVVVVVGGAEEAFHSRPGNYSFVLKRRKGFVRMAMHSGAPIVPAISFNEVDLYEQAAAEPGSPLRRLQGWLKKMTTVAFVIPFGRSAWLGLTPKRKAITTVVGAPIELPHRPNPSRSEVDRIHAIFCDELTRLFEKHKTKYIENADKVHILII